MWSRPSRDRVVGPLRGSSRWLTACQGVHRFGEILAKGGLGSRDQLDAATLRGHRTWYGVHDQYMAGSLPNCVVLSPYAGSLTSLTGICCAPQHFGLGLAS